MSPAVPDVRLDRRGDVFWVWIDREARRNALNSSMKLPPLANSMRASRDCLRKYAWARQARCAVENRPYSRCR